MDDANTIANLLTAIVCAVTAWMAWETRKLARSTREMAELESLPDLSLFELGFEQKMKEATPFRPERPDGLRPLIRLRNPGRVRVIYDVHEVFFSLEGKAYPVKNFDNHEGVVHAGETATFLFPVLNTGFVLAPGMSGQLGIKLLFWRSADRRERLSFKLRFDVARAGSNIVTSFVFLEGPTYTQVS